MEVLCASWTSEFSHSLGQKPTPGKVRFRRQADVAMPSLQPESMPATTAVVAKNQLATGTHVL
jgi:hypothetical protein